MHTTDLQSSSSVQSTFWRYAFPSVLAMLVSGLFQIVDGMFIGHYIGAQGLAGINLAWPIISIIAGFGMMLGLGGGSLISIYQGEGKPEKAKLILSTTLLLSLLIGVLCYLLLLLFSAPLLALQNADGVALEYALEYLLALAPYASFTIAAICYPFLVRNDNSPNLATALVVIAALINLVLDYYFIGVKGWGMKGAAVATAIAQGSIFVCAWVYFFSAKCGLKLKLSQLKFSLVGGVKSLNLGLSAFAMYVYFGFVVAVHNLLLLKYGSDISVGAFAIISYLGTLYYLLSQGLAEGMQPLVSYFKGANETRKLKKVVILALNWVIGAGIVWTLALNFYPETAIGLFSGADSALLAETKTGLRLHLFALVLDGFFALVTVYFMATSQANKAMLVSVGNMLIQLPFLYAFPLWFGIEGVWLALPASNILLALLIAPILIKDLRQRSDSSNQLTPVVDS